MTYLIASSSSARRLRGDKSLPAIKFCILDFVHPSLSPSSGLWACERIRISVFRERESIRHKVLRTLPQESTRVPSGSVWAQRYRRCQRDSVLHHT